MSEKYSDFQRNPSNDKYFFANYGCCIPTEQYTWMLIVLFLTTVVVLLFCMLATATVRWMYKRRMRKRLHDLKKKYLSDQVKSREFEEKLHEVAQKSKSLQNREVSAWGEPEKVTIHVDAAQKNVEKKKKPTSFQQKPSLGGHVNAKAPVSEDPDETPLAQSTLASKSNTKLASSSVENPKKTTSIQKAPEPPTTPSAPPPTIDSYLQKQENRSEEYDNLTQPSDAVASKLAPPTSTTTEFTSGTMTGTNGNAETTGTSGVSGSTVTTPSIPPTSSAVSAAPNEGKTQNASPGDNSKQKVRGPLVTEEDEEEDRKEGAGGRNEHFHTRRHKRVAPPSSVTSTSHRTRSWLFDSTGSGRFDAGRDGASRSSSVLKTDSSLYKTASVSRFPHGAFTFQQ